LLRGFSDLLIKGGLMINDQAGKKDSIPDCGWIFVPEVEMFRLVSSQCLRKSLLGNEVAQNC
jgi:hypothetical protein